MNDTTQAQDSVKKRAIGRKQGIMIFSIVFISMAIATFIHKTGIGMPTNTVNKGTLMDPPLQLQDLQLKDSSDEDIFSTGKKWRLLIPYTKSCGKKCDANLFVTRQVHIRLGDKARRVERVLLSFDAIDSEQRAHFSEQHPRMRLANVNRTDFERWLGSSNAPRNVIQAGNYLLVDQAGFAMMFYSDQHHGNELLTDVKRLLKFSYEG